MKIKHLMIAGCLFTAFTLQSCIKEKDLYQAPPTTYSELNLQLDGDYLSTELPMARATTPTKINESETLVGIAITMTPKEGQNPSSKPYAYGIFQLDKAKDPNNLKIKVIDGYTYRISCSMIANAKDSIIKDEKGFFGAPFDLERSGKIKGECLNKFLTPIPGRYSHLFGKFVDTINSTASVATDDNYRFIYPFTRIGDDLQDIFFIFPIQYLFVYFSC